MGTTTTTSKLAVAVAAATILARHGGWMTEWDLWIAVFDHFQSSVSWELIEDVIAEMHEDDCIDCMLVDRDQMYFRAM